jgi:ornithine cyclodeaminase/alanine dehydrogenase-like protein (mu-crystallin family)
MALLIDNDAADRLLEMDDAIDAIAEALTQHGDQQAAFYSLQQLASPTAAEGDAFVWGHHLGAIRDPPRLALRFKSDVTEWVEHEGGTTREKFNVEPETFMGFVLLFDTSTGELLGLLNDGIVQHVRVGATAGVGCAQFARTDAETVGLVGSGGMAEVYLEAFAEVRDLSRARVYSPTADHRESFAAEMSDRLEVAVEAVDDPETAVRGADIVATCTDASQPVIEADWLGDGVFLTNVRALEIPSAAIEAADRRYTTSNQAYETRVLGSEDERASLRSCAGHGAHDTDFTTLGAVLCRDAEGRQTPEDVIYFDNRAMGIQFAAVGDLAYRRARENGLGFEIPLSWFQQSMRN